MSGIKEWKVPMKITVEDFFMVFKLKDPDNPEVYRGYEEQVDRLAIVKSIGLARTRNETSVYASGKLVDRITAATGAEFTLGSIGLPKKYISKAFGEEQLQGFHLGSQDDIPNQFACGYVEKYRDGKKFFRWMPNCVLTKADDATETSTDTPPEPKDEYTITAMIGDSGDWKVDYDQHDPDIQGALVTLEEFFAKPLTCKQDVLDLIAEHSQNEPPLPELTVLSTEGTDSGKTALTVTPSLTSGNSYKYKTGASPQMPTLNQDCSTSTWTAWDGSAEITATAGEKIVVVEVDASSKCKKAGSATISVKA